MKNELAPTSEVDNIALVGDEYVSQVRTFGHLDTLHNVFAVFLDFVVKRNWH